MRTCFLSSYKLSNLQILQSIIAHEYGLRHLQEAKLHSCSQWEHRIIGVIELFPIIGPIVAIIEYVVTKHLVQSPHLIAKGSQMYSLGPVTQEKVAQIIDILNQKRPRGIIFNPEKIPQELIGGTCSAMAFEFLEHFFSIKKSSASFTEVIYQVIAAFARFRSSSQEKRERQAAFNAIEVIDGSEEIDITKNKIQSLLNYHNFYMKYASPEFDTSTTSREQLQEIMESLPNGAFVLRVLQPSSNEKREVCGHSVIYIRKKSYTLFYDPNYGLINLESCNHTKFFHRIFSEFARDFNIQHARSYRVGKSREESI